MAPAATSPDTTVRDVRATLDRRAAAVLDHDPDAYAATVAPGPPACGRPSAVNWPTWPTCR